MNTFFSPYQPWCSRHVLSATRFFFLFAFFVCGINQTHAQETLFDVEAYEAFIGANEDMLAGDVLTMHPAGLFLDRAHGAFRSAAFSDSIALKYGLTDYEEELVNRYGFGATERIQFDNFGDAYLDIYTKDLPVFVSTDAILHAVHMSYVNILKDTEVALLMPTLEALLAELHRQVRVLEERYRAEPGMTQPLRDLDVYLTVPRTLLEEGTVSPYFSENASVVEDLLGLIDSEEGFVSYPLFSEECRLLDFSQFKPRGHYADSRDLPRYFRAMMWLGRIELFLSAPNVRDCKPSNADVQRQTILSSLVVEAVESGDAAPLLDQMETFIQLFVGEQDNVTLEHIKELRARTGVERASDLLDEVRLSAFQETLFAEAWSMQRIQSHLLVSPRNNPEEIKPASAFLLLGQRFIIDSYVTGSVVFDKIEYDGSAVRRMLPKPLDVLFALGNNAAGQLLEPELDHYKYGTNLTASRYLIESYEDDFWQQSLYNGWLNAIRTLNPPSEMDRASLPEFMRTAAWWQQKMNTQLAAWAQLRHDNLLYAKQSYTGIPSCEYPFTYIEPIPAFYEAVSAYARNAKEQFDTVEASDDYWWILEGVRNHFGRLASVNDTLAVIAQKELDGVAVDEAETNFLRRVMYHQFEGCAVSVNGWYPQLFYPLPETSQEPDLVVADIHTAPADASGNIVGWVLHVGTGPINMALVTADVPGKGPVAFVGPVMSYYEHLSTNFERLTDEVWETAHAAAPSHRPQFVNIYLADEAGQPRGAGPTLATATSTETGPADTPVQHVLPASNYPNPFRGATNITFSVPSSRAFAHVEVEIFDAQGRSIDRLVNETLPAGNYSVRWDGALSTVGNVASGVYFCRLRIGDEQFTTPMARVQ